MIYPLVRELAADKIPVAVTYRVLGFSKQAFYKWQANPVSQRDWDDAHLINAAIDIHHDAPEFGYRFTEDPTVEGKLDLCAVKDACAKRIVGYSISDRMTSDLAVTALGNALALRRPVGAIVHSDRGSQFHSHAYVRALRDAQLRGSMGRVGACPDNAAMESLFSLLQKTSSTAGAGLPASNCAWRSSSGSKGPTTAADAKTPSDA
jgi:transposase InsO family protein